MLLVHRIPVADVVILTVHVAVENTLSNGFVVVGVGGPGRHGAGGILSDISRDDRCTLPRLLQ